MSVGFVDDDNDKISTNNPSPMYSKQDIDDFTKQFASWTGTGERVVDKTLFRFFQDAPSVSDPLQQGLREEARSLFLQKKSQELLNNDELKQILTVLEDNQSPPLMDEEKMINYSDFVSCKDKVTDKAKPFITANVFSKLLHDDPYGRVSTQNIFNYIMRKTWYRQSRIGLSLYDLTGQGYLSEKDLELYIMEQLPTLPQLQKLDESFHSFYMCTAVRKFMFFLDPLKQGKVRIVDILASGFLDDLLELRDDGQMSPRKIERNWFSADSAMNVYGQYLNLDLDRDGMLSKEELSKYGTGTLTKSFIDRVFQECLTYEGEMDYKGYLDFVLAMENKRDASSLQYFLRIIDVRHKGYLDAFAINYFFRDIQLMLDESDQQPVLFEDIKDEIFDMVKPVDPHHIKLQDLISSSQGDTVVNILIDLNGFLTYENREVLATEPDDDDDCE